VGEALLALARAITPGLAPGRFANRALQSSYAQQLTPIRLIDEVKRTGGSVHLFLNDTWVLADALDADLETPTRDQLFALLDRGVDGVMTDRPGWVRLFIASAGLSLASP
jgi:hypothetical protein